MSRQDRNKRVAKVLDMTAGSPSALLLRFSMPLVCGNLFQQAYSFGHAALMFVREDNSATFYSFAASPNDGLKIILGLDVPGYFECWR